MALEHLKLCLVKLNLRNVAAWNNDKANEAIGHIDFDSCGFVLCFLPRLGFLQGSFLDSGRGREAIFECVG